MVVDSVRTDANEPREPMGWLTDGIGGGSVVTSVQTSSNPVGGIWT